MHKKNGRQKITNFKIQLKVAMGLYFSLGSFKKLCMFQVYFIQKKSEKLSHKILECKNFLLNFLYLIIVRELPQTIVFKKKIHCIKSFIAASNFQIIQRKRLFFSSS